MEKGISPVVSVVLLIAIAVVAAAGVWFWVAPMFTETQASSTAGKYQVRLTNCRGSAGSQVVSVRNIGTSNTPSTATAVPIYSSTGTRVGNISLAVGLSAGSYNNSVPLNNETTSALSGTLYIEDSTFAKTTFSC